MDLLNTKPSESQFPRDPRKFIIRNMTSVNQIARLKKNVRLGVARTRLIERTLLVVEKLKEKIE